MKASGRLAIAFLGLLVTSCGERQACGAAPGAESKAAALGLRRDAEITAHALAADFDAVLDLARPVAQPAAPR
jgi:hypothetical protein